MAKKKTKAKLPKPDRVEIRIACDIPEGMKKAIVKKMIAEAVSERGLTNVKSEFI